MQAGESGLAWLTMPDHVNFLEAIVLPNEQLSVGRGLRLHADRLRPIRADGNHFNRLADQFLHIIHVLLST